MKNKIKHLINDNKTRTSSLILLLIFIISGYLFFFNSTKIFGENYDYTISEIGETITLESGHTVKLTRADIDLEKNCIEYEFYFQNSNYDGCDDYKVSIRSTTRTGKISSLETQTICTDSDVYVVRAPLRKSWVAVVADIQVKNSDDITLATKFYSNAGSLYQTTIEGNTREYFLKLDTNRNIEKLSDEILFLQDTNVTLERKISEIDNNIQKIHNRMTYMTTDELKEAEINLISMSSDKESCIRQIDDNKKLISQYRENIATLQEETN